MAQMTLKAARVNAGLTQEKAAKEIGISVSTLKNWENGISFPKQPHIMKLCNVYNVNYDDIFFDSRLALS